MFAHPTGTPSGWRSDEMDPEQREAKSRRRLFPDVQVSKWDLMFYSVSYLHEYTLLQTVICNKHIFIVFG